MKSIPFLSTFVGLSVLALSVCDVAHAATIASSTFDNNLDGWTTSSTTEEVTWQSSGGNPGGYAHYQDNNPNGTDFYAPGKFLGNWTAEGVTSLSFDFKIFAETQVIQTGSYEIGISGPGGSALWVGSALSGNPTDWITETASISLTGGTGWTLESGSWATLLNDVTVVDIPIELITNDQSSPWTDIEGEDNIILSSGVSQTPLPATLPLFAGGLGLVGFLSRWKKRKAVSDLSAA